MDKLETQEDLVNHPLFKERLDHHLNALRTARLNRPEPKPGFYYPRDWYDRMVEKSLFNITAMMEQIPLVWQKKDKLNHEFRSIIREIAAMVASDVFQAHAAEVMAQEKDHVKQEIIENFKKVLPTYTRAKLLQVIEENKMGLVVTTKMKKSEIVDAIIKLMEG